MKHEITFSDDEIKVSFDDTPELRQEVFEAVLDFYIKHRAFAGESICQNDDCNIEAAPELAVIADNLFKFKVEYKQ